MFKTKLKCNYICQSGFEAVRMTIIYRRHQQQGTMCIPTPFLICKQSITSAFSHLPARTIFCKSGSGFFPLPILMSPMWNATSLEEPDLVEEFPTTLTNPNLNYSVYNQTALINPPELFLFKKYLVGSNLLTKIFN